MFSLKNTIEILKSSQERKMKLSDLVLLDYVSPIYVISIVSLINQWIIHNDHLGLVLPELNTYLERCWFFYMIGKANSVSPYTWNSQNLIEITPITSIEQNEILARWWVDEICSKLFVRAKNIQKGTVEGKKFLDNLENTLLLAVTELLDNIAIHSEADLTQNACMYMLQYYPSKKRTKLAIIDNGIGIIESLKQSSHLDPNKEDKDYLLLALERSITNGKGKWNWLAMVREIIEETQSKLEIYTNGVLYTKIWQKENIEYTWTGYKGTMINIEFNMEAIEWEKTEWLKSFNHIPIEMDDLNFYNWIFE